MLKLSFIPLAMILLLGFAPESFSETELKTVEIFVQPPTGLTMENDIKDDEQKPPPQNSPNSPSESPTAFITGNDYALNSNAIYINTDEGLSLNNLLIEQIETERKNVEHTDSFWSRADQLIMGNFGVINALQNPFTENNYHIEGEKYSENTNSNLEYFVQERGYDLDNLQDIPNHMVTPKKYDLSRAVSKEISNPLSSNLDVQHVRDLRDVSPNAFDFTPQQEMQMFRESVKNTSFDVVGALMPRLMVDESWFEPESTAQTNSNMKNIEKQNISQSMVESQKQEEQKKQVEEEKLFQETSHIKDLIANSGYEPNYDLQENSQFPIFEIITSFGMFVSSFITCQVIIRHYRNSQKTHLPSITIESKNNYLTEVESLLTHATSLYRQNNIKDAYEKLSQSIRLFYSNRLELEKEIITSDLLPLMKRFDSHEKSLVEESLRLSDMIEFAKHIEKDNKFEQIITEFSKIVRKEKI
ncbi:hypothetical protein A7X95_01270 [Candidatus Nitrosopelagicus brevis]|uniref:Uncharacterized protein n=2 Tax=Candidatus Nitrosopelagicus brevis TaxID=1410606 RepID=A0A0A7UZI2_9ARCH|nr:hypothetical protein [Candidatus Nitrosopelagicus brevis]AJA92157.1 hypothetical protein T478_0679 [Candidatus Nitrosopelagicus brevis]PTL87938.1 hypothetical protein A7X95_01270 [Candidatus Nitrosopelagicus brevis]